ncbi:MAG: hypothetical protein JWO80_1038 [Bryobacterales bacterium]|nr:hypothetical protein [Bryobacterales bacterium]
MRKPAILLCALAACASGGPADTFRMAGSVVNDITGEPVRRATVGLQCQGGTQVGVAVQTTTADAGGRFEFPNLSPGRCMIWAERRGFARRNVTQDAGPDGGEAVIRLTPYGVVTGKVVDENGDPMIGANVQVLQSMIAMGQRLVRPANSAATNDLGEYRIAQLPPGRYYVSAAVPVRSTGSPMKGLKPSDADSAAEDTTYAPLYYAGASDFSSATPIELAPGAEGRADFHMQPARGFTISGRIANMPPGFNGMVMLGPRNAVDHFNGPGRPVQVSQDTGAFIVKDVTPGQYVVSASAFQGGERLSGSQEVSVARGDLEDVTVAVSKGAAISGTVRIEEKEGVPALDTQRLAVMLRPKDFGFNPQPSARLRPDKSFILPEITPGEYVLQIAVQDPYYVKSAVLGSLDALSGSISISGGEATAPLDIVIGSNGAEVSGTVMKGDRPVSNCSVLLTRRGGLAASQEKIVRTDANGKFTLSATAPGDYIAYAWQDVNAIEYRNPQVLQRYQGENLTVAEGGKQTVRLRLNDEP